MTFFITDELFSVKEKIAHNRGFFAPSSCPPRHREAQPKRSTPPAPTNGQAPPFTTPSKRNNETARSREESFTTEAQRSQSRGPAGCRPSRVRGLASQRGPSSVRGCVARNGSLSSLAGLSRRADQGRGEGSRAPPAPPLFQPQETRPTLPKSVIARRSRSNPPLCPGVGYGPMDCRASAAQWQAGARRQKQAPPQRR